MKVDRLSISASLALALVSASATAAAEKPKVAVFPLAGSASADQREKVGFSLRAKLDRDGHYEPIDGPTMTEVAGEKMIAAHTSIDDLQALSKDEHPRVIVWGQLDDTPSGLRLRLKTFDVNQPHPLPHELEKTMAQPTDVRFAVEDILQTLEGIERLAHPNEEAV